MTVVVFVILAVIWGAVLLPPYLQNRRESRPGDSIASFRAQLSVLERTSPGYRRTAGPSRSALTGRSALSGAARPAAARLGAAADRRRAPVRASAPASARVATRSPAALRRAEQRRRRRDVFVTLLAAAGLTFLLALLVAYVGLLIQIQQRSAEREMKVRYLHRPAPVQASDPALLLRRSAN